MVILLCVRWWYGSGWAWVIKRGFSDRLQWILASFSTVDLARTLFAPFRQTFAGGVKGSLGDHFRAFIDRLVSRAIGFVIRLFLILISLVACFVALLVGLVVVVAWALLPILPLVGVVAWLMGWGV